MYPTRWMRILRIKHKITHKQLADAAHVSRRRIVEIEPGTSYTTEYQRELVAEAFRIVIEQRSKDCGTLKRDFARLEYRLLEFAKEGETL